MISIFSAESLPNQTNVSMGRSGALEMAAWGAKNSLPRLQNDSRELQVEAQEHRDGPSESANGCPDEQWQLNLLLKEFLKANLNAPGSLRG